ncbi:hypothetical protein P3T73_09820 [Kiritimatiellota bacterium B12222]|nr:hypothetical protein P3T73_09820 [Kiritimatiellota bacterium B12222]
MDKLQKRKAELMNDVIERSVKEAPFREAKVKLAHSAIEYFLVKAGFDPEALSMYVMAYALEIDPEDQEQVNRAVSAIKLRFI